MDNNNRIPYECSVMGKHCIREEGLEILLANIDAGINSSGLGTLWLDAGFT